MRVFLRFPFFLPLLPVLFSGCAPKTKTPLPGGEFLRAMQQRAGQPQKEVAFPSHAPSGISQPAFIDVKALAQRLPSWQLATKLEKSAGSLQFSPIGAPQGPRNLQIRSGPLETAFGASGGRFPGPAGENDEPINGAPGYERPAQRVAARDATPLENQGHQRQEGTLESFLADIARKQDAARGDNKMRLKAELEDEIEASQRLALASLEPLLPPPATQLEMTNLRIQLLPNAPTTAEEKSLAAAHLAQLEAEWRAQLREQAHERFEELRRLLTEVPIEKREQGLNEIEKTLAERGLRDENLRKIVADALRNRIVAGFGADDTMPLFIQLPGAQLPAQTLQGTPIFAGPALPHIINNQIKSNTTPLWPSAAAFAGESTKARAVPASGSLPLTSNKKQVTALRQQALQEATQWARSIARRQNWRLQNRSTNSRGQNVPDRTREALQLLNL